MMMLIIIILEGCWSSGEGCLEQERSALLHLKLFFNTPDFLTDWVGDKNYYSDCCSGKVLSAATPVLEESYHYILRVLGVGIQQRKCI